MMFLIIKTLSESSEGKNTFKLFDIALDGEYLCSLRYSQLLSFNEELKKAFPDVQLASFPPKKMLTLDEVQMEERRFTLEKFLQSLSLNARISTSNMFKNYLLAAQYASWSGGDSKVPLGVHLLNGKTVDLEVTALDRADVVQLRLAKQMGLPDHLYCCFALHLVEVQSDDSLTVLRRIYDFESPFITLSTADKCRIVFMRTFWHKSFHADLVADKTGRNLLFVDAAHAYDRGWWNPTPEDKKVLDKTHQKSQKKEFLEVVSKQADYLTSRVDGLHVDIEGLPHAGYARLGQDEVRLYCRPEGEGEGEGEEAKHQLHVMKMSRVRCWKMAYMRDKDRLTLAIHYLLSKDKMEWIYIWGKSVTFLAQGIQAVVQDLIRIAHKGKIKMPVEDSGVIPVLPKVNRREISQPIAHRRPAPRKPTSSPPTTPTTSTTPNDRLPSVQSTAKPTPVRTPSDGEPPTLESAGEDARSKGDESTDGQAVSRTDPPSEAATKTPSSSKTTDMSPNVGSSSNEQPSSGVGSSSRNSKPSPPTFPKDKLKSFTAVEDSVESSRSITNVLKRLTSFKSSEVSNDIFDQAIGDDDL